MILGSSILVFTKDCFFVALVTFFLSTLALAVVVLVDFKFEFVAVFLSFGFVISNFVCWYRFGFDDFKNASLAHNGGFACLGPAHAGDTRVVGQDPLNLRANNLSQRVFCGCGFVWARGSSRGLSNP